jgi:hypothetical protein
MAQPITRAQVKTPDPFNFSTQVKTPDPFNFSRAGAQVKTPDPFNFSQIKTPDPFNCSLLISLWGEELGEQGEHVRASGFIDFSKSFDQAALIDASYLIQDDLS